MIKIPSGIKAIIFDLDGTLADTMPLHYEACQIVCNKKGFDFPYEFFLSEAGRPTNDVFIDLVKNLSLDVDALKLAKEKENLFLSLIPKVKPLPIVKKVFDEYLSKLPMAIGSGGQRESVIRTLDALGLTNDFDAIVSCDDVKRHKPYPDTFLKAASLMGIDPKNCIVLEDGDPGIKAAIDAGMQFIDIRVY